MGMEQIIPETVVLRKEEKQGALPTGGAEAPTFGGEASLLGIPPEEEPSEIFWDKVLGKQEALAPR